MLVVALAEEAQKEDADSVTILGLQAEENRVKDLIRNRHPAIRTHVRYILNK